jgi:hypothetical protein
MIRLSFRFPESSAVARLTYKQRKNMGSDQFAVPSKRKGGKGGYPIPDKSHARDALARVANKSPALRAKVRAAVHRKFPSIKIGGAKK